MSNRTFCVTTLGRKTRRGFYVYRNGHSKPNRKLNRVARESRKQSKTDHGPLSDDTIRDRAILIMLNEAARCLEEGVVPSAETLDLAMVMGTGFAPFRGGLMHYADARGIDDIKNRMDELSKIYGDRFELAPLLVEMARTKAEMSTQVGVANGPSPGAISTVRSTSVSQVAVIAGVPSRPVHAESECWQSGCRRSS